MSELVVDFLLGSDLSSRFIAWYGNGYGGYSHAASRIADGRYIDARADVIAGVPAGVRVRDPKTESWIRKRTARKACTQGEYDGWEASLRAKITDQYDIPDIWGFITGRKEHDAGHWICSALVINAVQHIKLVPFPLPVPAHQITPNAALLILATAGFSIGPELSAL